ncbi:MAG: hypothetical protein Kow0063_32180 [Anaerolineae bacterium]
MKEARTRTSSGRQDWLLAVSITLIACFTHLYRLAARWPVATFDPAYNGLDALRVLRRGVTPIFFPANGGREPLFLYLQVLAIGVLGANTFALRLPGALAGALTAPLTFGFARAIMVGEDGWLRRWVPVWSSLGLALSVWSLSQTRVGLRAALLPIFSVGIMWLFIAGWRRASLSRLAAAGALLGLSAYTYTAARFLPFILLIVALPDLLARRSVNPPPHWQRWLGLGTMGLVAIAVFAPLGWYYLSHPVMFDERASSVMIWNVWQPGSGTTLAEELALSLWRTLSWFVRMPVPLLVGLLAGLGFTLTRLSQTEYRLLPIWWLIMLLPAAFTTETPNLLRSLGAAPPTYLLIGLGLGVIARWLTRHWSVATNIIVVAGLLLITLSSLPGLWDYFHPTRRVPETATQALGAALARGSQTDVVYLPLSAYANPSMRFLLASDFQERADWSAAPIPGSRRLVQPAEGSDLSILVRLSPDGWITMLPPLLPEGQQALRETATNTRPIVDQYGMTVGHEVILPDWADPAHYLAQIELSTDVTVPGLADLWGYRLDEPDNGRQPPHLVPGGPLWITTFWKAHGGASEDYDLTIRLVDETGHIWGQADGPPLEGAYPTSLWRPGEKVADGRLMWVYPDAPPGRYWITVAFYDYLTDSRLPVSGSPIPDTVRLGPLKIPLPPLAEPPDGLRSQSARFGDMAQLLGYRLSPQPDGFRLTLYWQAEVPDGIDYTIFVHLLDETGELVMGQDNQPVSGSYPTGIWEPGEIIVDEYSFDTSDLQAGKYQIETGMYDLATGERLPVHMPDGTGDPNRRLLLNTPVEVR